MVWGGYLFTRTPGADAELTVSRRRRPSTRRRTRRRHRRAAKPSQRRARESKITRKTASAAPAIVAISTGRKASGSSLPDEAREQRDDGRDQHRHLGRRRDRDLGAEAGVAAPRGDDRAAVLGRVPDERDDHRRDEELR